MQALRTPELLTRTIILYSAALGREVRLDLYEAFRFRQEGIPLQGISLLLINDGQDLPAMGFGDMLAASYAQQLLRPLVCVGIHAGPDRLMEYGTAGKPDYKGWGARAGDYTRFVLDELLPHIRSVYADIRFRETAFAGFSLGALSAMDIVWAHSNVFSRAGLFSGSFWWRTRDKNDPAYQEDSDRIMQQLVRNGSYHPGLHFFFECGTEDEWEDRNGNGIIDSIDDTQDLIRELVGKGYTYEFNVPPGEEQSCDIRYVEVPAGRHEVATWGMVMPTFLQWGWGV